MHGGGEGGGGRPALALKCWMEYIGMAQASRAAVMVVCGHLLNTITLCALA